MTRRPGLITLRNQDIIETDDRTLRVLIRRSNADPFSNGRIAFT